MSVSAEAPLDSQSGSLVQSRWFAELNMVLVALIWGLNMPIMKLAIQKMDPYLFNALRLTFSALTLGLLVWWKSRSVKSRQKSDMPFRYWAWRIVLFSILSGFTYQVLFLLGINNTSAVNTSLIITSIPVWIAVLAMVLLKERLTGLAWFGLGIAVAGTIVVGFCKSGEVSVSNSLIGNLLVFIAAFSWALASVWSRPLMKSFSPITLAFFAVALTLPGHYLIASDQISRTLTVLSDPLLFWSIVYSGVFSTGLAYAMWNLGIRKLGAAHGAAYQNLVPAFAIISSFLIIAEIPVFLQILGGVLIILGLIIMRKNQGASK